jgi:chemosensory pili system protein ChpA (sensor histidine kinase/response regulator)
VKLERAVEDLQRDAAVVADDEVSKQSVAALQVIQGAERPDQTGVFRAIQDLAPENAPEAPAPQVVQLVDAPGAEVDQELLEIFLEEATEVVDTIASSLATAREAPHDRESLTTIRRGFHTLKGSGRMVGLNELGEMAWQCEQVMNKLLKDEKPASAQLIGFIDLAQSSFRGWVGDLKATGTARFEGGEITRRAEALKSGEALAPAGHVAIEPAEAQPAEAAATVELATEPLQPEWQPEPVAERAETPPEVAAPVGVPGEATREASSEDAAPVAQPESPAFTFESLELSPAVEAPPAAAFEREPQPVRDVAPEPMVEAAAATEVAPESAPVEEADVVVGPVRVSATLFAIYVGRGRAARSGDGSRDGLDRGRPHDAGERRFHARRAYAREQLAHDRIRAARRGRERAGEVARPRRSSCRPSSTTTASRRPAMLSTR